MLDELHHYVSIRADFEWSGEFDAPAGRKLAEILQAGLPGLGVEVAAEFDTDFFFYLECSSGNSRIELMVGAEPQAETRDFWFVQPCRSKSGGKSVDDQDYRRLLLAVNDVLRQAATIRSVRWYPFVDSPSYLELLPYDDSPIQSQDYWQRVEPLIRWELRISQAPGWLFSPMGCLIWFLSFFLISLISPQWAMGIAGGLFVCVILSHLFVPAMLVAIARRRRASLAAGAKPEKNVEMLSNSDSGS